MCPNASCSLIDVWEDIYDPSPFRNDIFRHIKGWFDAPEDIENVLRKFKADSFSNPHPFELIQAHPVGSATRERSAGSFKLEFQTKRPPSYWLVQPKTNSRFSRGNLKRASIGR